MSLLTVEHLRKEYPEATPLTDVCFQVEEGDVISVIGASGTGKSTLLRCLNRLEVPTSGRVFVDGEEITDPACDVTRLRRKMGMVFQQFNLFANLNVLDNVCAAPIKLLKVPREQVEREAMELLERVGLADKAQRFPDELSGGQQQRVAIARAVAMKPKVLLLDEPTSALDPTMVGEVLSVIRALAREGMTMMIVTHEMRFARDVSNRVIYLDEGVVYEEGAPEQVFDHPQRERTRRFIKRLRTHEMVISEASEDYPALISQIERFGSEAAMSPRAVRNLMLAYEELVSLRILPAVRKGLCELPVKVEFEHSEVDGQTAMRVLWEGERFDPLAEGDELSDAILRSLLRQESYRYDGLNELAVTL